MKKVRLLFLLTLPILVCFSCTRIAREQWENGNTKSEITLKGDQRNGPARYWYEDGNIQMECTYQNDRLNGTLTRYYSYPDGTKEEQQNYRNDSLEGPSLAWDRSGNLLVQTQYAKGKPHGTYREFYENKMIKTEGSYVFGNIDGLWLYYDDTGLVIGKGTFKMGNGEQRSFYPGTVRVKMITTYKNNLKDGEETEYSPEGKIIRMRVYSSGKVIEVKTNSIP